MDGRAALFAVGVTLLTTVGFALAPAVQAARADAGELLRAGTRGTSRATPVRTALLAVQFAASLALLGVGGLFVRSLQNVQGVDVGFALDRSLVASGDWDAFGVTSKEGRALLARGGRAGARDAGRRRRVDRRRSRRSTACRCRRCACPGATI